MKPGDLRRGLGVAGAHQVGVEEAEVSAPDLHAAGRELGAQTVAEPVHSRLGGGVGADHRRVHDRAQRGDVQQIAAAGDQLLHHRAIGAPDSEQVDGERALDLLDRRADQRAGERDAGIGDRHVDPAEPLYRAVHGALQRIEVGHVRLKRLRAVAQTARELLQLLWLEADQREIRALTMQALRGRGADAARGAGDEHGAPAHVERGSGGAAHTAANLMGSRAGRLLNS
jgi:hypothetical protein